MPERTVDEWNAMNEPVVAAFRANGGTVRGRRNMLLLTTRGARTGQPRVTPLNHSRDGERYVVIASKGGSATHPAWFHNLVADPEVIVEVGTERFHARARVAQEPERTRLYDAQAAIMPFFDGYRRTTTAREIPVVVLERLPEAP